MCYNNLNFYIILDNICILFIIVLFILSCFYNIKKMFLYNYNNDFKLNKCNKCKILK